MKFNSTIIVLLFTLGSYAQELKLFPSSTTVALNECLTLHYVIDTSVEEIFPPDFHGFSISEQKVFSKLIIEDDVRTIKKCFTFILKPIATGNYSIEKASVQIDNLLLHTEPLQIKVIEEVKKPKTNNCSVTEEDIQDYFEIPL